MLNRSIKHYQSETFELEARVTVRIIPSVPKASSTAYKITLFTMNTRGRKRHSRSLASSDAEHTGAKLRIEKKNKQYREDIGLESWQGFKWVKERGEDMSTKRIWHEKSRKWIVVPNPGIERSVSPRDVSGRIGGVPATILGEQLERQWQQQESEDAQNRERKSASAPLREPSHTRTLVTDRDNQATARDLSEGSTLVGMVDTNRSTLDGCDGRSDTKIDASIKTPGRLKRATAVFSSGFKLPWRSRSSRSTTKSIVEKEERVSPLPA